MDQLTVCIGKSCSIHNGWAAYASREMNTFMHAQVYLKRHTSFHLVY